MKTQINDSMDQAFSDFMKKANANKCKGALLIIKTEDGLISNAGGFDDVNYVFEMLDNARRDNPLIDLAIRQMIEIANSQCKEN